MNTKITLFTLLALVLIIGGQGAFAGETSPAKAVLVTGASSGIGLQITESLSPDAEQATITIRFAMQRLLQLNEDQPYSYSRDNLVALMDALLKTK